MSGTRVCRWLNVVVFAPSVFYWLSGQRFNKRYKVLGIKYKVGCRNAEAESRMEVGQGVKWYKVLGIKK